MVQVMEVDFGEIPSKDDVFHILVKARDAHDSLTYLVDINDRVVNRGDFHTLLSVYSENLRSQVNRIKRYLMERVLIPSLSLSDHP